MSENCEDNGKRCQWMSLFSDPTSCPLPRNLNRSLDIRRSLGIPAVDNSLYNTGQHWLGVTVTPRGFTNTYRVSSSLAIGCRFFVILTSSSMPNPAGPFAVSFVEVVVSSVAPLVSLKTSSIPGS